jgi:hypothetical protein
MVMPKTIWVRKARGNGRVSCGHFVKKGELIISLNGRNFMCYECRQKQRTA